ncbi:hypothetical protein [Micromonospora sp. NPDC002575]|uniref:hypothetical protein n=1 Tax=Micromonospora sp. NPDC002575 TaxID=3364222 RepID=UPI003698E0A0
MTLWIPPNADLGELAGPSPDPRMKNFIGGFDAQGQVLPMTYMRMRAAAEKWVITKATPEGPATLLKSSRDMFCLGYYSYELVACSNSWSLFAVEAALKLRFNASKGTSFNQLIKAAHDQALISDYLADILDTGRQLRNRFVHEGKQPVWTLGMTGKVIGASFRIVADLYPEDEDVSESVVAG